MAGAMSSDDLRAGPVKFMLASMSAAMAGAMSSDCATSWREGWLYFLSGGPSAAPEFREARTHCGSSCWP